MTDLHKSAATFVAEEKLRLAAANLKHFLKIQNEQITLEDLKHDILQSMADAHAGNPDDMSAVLAKQMRVLDATYDYYMDKATGKYTEDDKVSMALRAQSQALRTINTWARLKHSPERGTK